MKKRFVIPVMALLGVLLGSFAVAAEGTAVDISAYTTGLESIIAAITAYAPTLIGVVGAVIAGFFAVKLGLRFLRQHVK